jgi:hypothetical protein
MNRHVYYPLSHRSIRRRFLPDRQSAVSVCTDEEVYADSPVLGIPARLRLSHPARWLS